MENRFQSFKPAIDAQAPAIQQPVKKTEVKANADKFKPKVDRAKDIQNQKIQKIAADEFDEEYQKVEPKVKQGGANARRAQDDRPKRYGTSDRKPDERGKPSGRGKFQGKAREDAHPMDRHSGTGRGRDMKKGGQGKGNWGRDDHETFENKDTKVVEAVQEEETKDIVDAAENKVQAEDKSNDKSDKSTPQVQQEEEEEEQDQGMTLDEFLATKKKATAKAQIRETEKIDQNNLKVNDSDKMHQETIAAQITDAQMYNPMKSDNVELFGFKGEDDMIVRTKTKGGRKHKSFKKNQNSNAMQVDEESFPSF